MSRAARWAARRLGGAPGGPAHTGALAVVSGWARLKEGIRPARPGMTLAQALRGREGDAEADFRAELGHLTPEETDALAVSFRREALVWAGLGAACAAAAPLLPAPAALPLLVTGLAMVLRGLAADYTAWRLRSRSARPPLAYLSRLPSVLWRRG